MGPVWLASAVPAGTPPPYWVSQPQPAAFSRGPDRSSSSPSTSIRPLSLLLTCRGYPKQEAAIRAEEEARPCRTRHKCTSTLLVHAEIFRILSRTDGGRRRGVGRNVWTRPARCRQPAPWFPQNSRNGAEKGREGEGGRLGDRDARPGAKPEWAMIARFHTGGAKKANAWDLSRMKPAGNCSSRAAPCVHFFPAKAR